MEHLGSVVCILVLMIFGSHQGVTARKPKMIPNQKELIIQQGETLNITCESEDKRPIIFSKESLVYSFADVSECYSSDYEHHGKFVYTYTCPNALPGDTGWYACAKDGIEINNTELTIEHPDEDISWIYVYVNSSSVYINTVLSIPFVPAEAGKSAVIPCRTTSPRNDVELRVNFSPMDESDQYEYDPKIGFIIPNVTKNYHDVHDYSCHTNNTDLEYLATYRIRIAVKNAPLPQPIIDEDTLRPVIWGTNHTLSCKVMSNRLDRYFLNWTAPNSIPHERLIFTDGYAGLNQESYFSNLTIINVQPTDSGTYICRVMNVEQRTLDLQANIITQDPNNTYINVSSTNPDQYDFSIRVSATETAKWTLQYDSYPALKNWEWFHPSGHQITDIGKSQTAKYSYTVSGRFHTFRISNVGIRDIGNYSIRFTTSAEYKDIDLILFVDAKPSTTINNGSNYYLPGKLLNFDCSVGGSPLPNVTWHYIEYPDFPSKANFIKISSLDFENSPSVDTPLYSLVSHLRIAIDMTGDLICEGCNTFGCTENAIPIFVSDVPGSFEIVKPDIVTEGDNISLICGASVYNYTNSITWYYNNAIGGETNDRILITPKKTNFTHQSILTINHVRKSDSASYSCQVRNMEGDLETQTYDLSVEDAYRPVIETNINTSQIVIELSKKDFSKQFTCNVSGLPIPKVIWTKDNKPLVNNDQYVIGSNNSTLTIRYFVDGDSGNYSCRAENRIGKAEKWVDILVKGKSPNNTIWISLICILIVIIIVVIIWIGVKINQERRLKKELDKAGLTHFEKGALECLNPDLTVDEQAELLPYDKKWEFPRELLKLGKQLGSGAFGVVMKAEARGICEKEEVTTVAVKMVRRSADPSYMKALSSELKIMIHLGRHLNVVNLLGACTKNIVTKRELYVIVEYCRYGNLHNYLQRHRDTFIDQIDPSTKKIDYNIGIDRLTRCPSMDSQNRLMYAALSFSRSISTRSSDSNSGTELVDYRQGTDFGDISMSPDGIVLSNNSTQPGWRSNYRGDYKDHNLKPICTYDLLCWAWQVSRGMEYLSSRSVLHGDLAARNILLADNDVVKICDFGLAKNMYKDNNYKKKGDGPLPIKWMAIESIRDRIFSTQSDVWSYGIVLWEFFTLARTPYPGMEAEKQYDRLISGYRMEKPQYATDEMYDIMQHCWKAKPSLRPTFPDLAEKLGTLLNETTREHYYDLNAPYTTMNNANLENGQNDYLTMMTSPSHDYHNSPDSPSEAQSTSVYLPMSPVNKGDESNIFSPRSELDESHFEFPPPNKNTPINSDSEDCIESHPMLPSNDAYLKPIDVQQRRAEFAKKSKEQAPPEKNPNYYNITNNSNLLNLNELSNILEKSDQNENKTKLQKNNTKESSPPIISGSDNYINMPQQKTDRLKETVDSYSNPSYVIMSK